MLSQPEEDQIKSFLALYYVENRSFYSVTCWSHGSKTQCLGGRWSDIARREETVEEEEEADSVEGKWCQQARQCGVQQTVGFQAARQSVGRVTAESDGVFSYSLIGSDAKTTSCCRWNCDWALYLIQMCVQYFLLSYFCFTFASLWPSIDKINTACISLSYVPYYTALYVMCWCPETAASHWSSFKGHAPVTRAPPPHPPQTGAWWQCDHYVYHNELGFGPVYIVTG